MTQTFAQKLAVGGKKNTLGLAEEVVQDVLQDKSRLVELYDCLFENDEWLRMRAADALEKVCRVHPEWLESYVDRLFDDLGNGQASFQWHLAQILSEVTLTSTQQDKAIKWLSQTLKDKNIDWIVGSNAMIALVKFAEADIIPKTQAAELIRGQQDHRSPSVRKRVAKLLAKLGA